ncbi:MAG: primosome assembly protein PriA [Bacillales bacterium]|jgi:primosomal protein N' (replication factor Y)|nr:primosome assembly protein PriA [Bacillales bacterium]
MILANVVVDVPAFATDKEYTYLIPIKYLETIEIGQRVIVPFGPTKKLGYITSIKDGEKFEGIKEIEEIIDVNPVITRELIHLSEWMKNKLLCYSVTALQAMLPAAMKATYTKSICLLGDEAVEHLGNNLKRIFNGKTSIDFNVIKHDGTLLKEIKDAVKDGYVEVVYSVKGKERVKTDKYVEKICDDGIILQIIDEIPKASKSKKKFLDVLLEIEKSKPLSFFLKDLKFNRETIKYFEKKNIISIYEKEIYRDHYNNTKFVKSEPLELSLDQDKVVNDIVSSIKQEKHETFLLHGVTGSGKTEIYLQSILEVISRGKEAIVLVPEISLTPQMVKRFKSRFSNQVAVLHSGLSIGEKYDEWRKILRKEVKVVVGARSAIFAPFENLGLIIIDEEHEGTYKQEDQPKYHTRDVAIYRGNFNNCPVVLGSATPAIETYARALKGVYKLLELKTRVKQQQMPEVHVVDLREELKDKNLSPFSRLLHEKIEDRLKKGEQIVLLLNRRGFSNFIMCRECGFVQQCPNCDVSLTYHKVNEKLKCHYCGYDETRQHRCPDCHSKHIRYFGTGTQKIEEELNKYFPEAKVIRMDVDTTSKKGSHEKLLTAFENEEADILLGTQMIAKGLDFPKVSLVGILSADSTLHIPDYKSAERTYQLITQVSGRAGRHEIPGEVVIQTYTSDHYSILSACKNNYLEFFNNEMWNRKQGNYPPYFNLCLINISHSENQIAQSYAHKIVNFIKSQNINNNFIILGPVVSPISRIQNKFRYQCLIKYKEEKQIVPVLKNIIDLNQKEITTRGLSINIDLHPNTFM